jgi:alpha-beta hydrolase superfamily lysophospholipase
MRNLVAVQGMARRGLCCDGRVSFARHLPAGSHRVIAGARHEILQEDDRYRAQLWAAFDAFMPG